MQKFRSLCRSPAGGSFREIAFRRSSPSPRPQHKLTRFAAAMLPPCSPFITRSSRWPLPTLPTPTTPSCGAWRALLAWRCYWVIHHAPDAVTRWLSRSSQAGMGDARKVFDEMPAWDAISSGLLSMPSRPTIYLDATRMMFDHMPHRMLFQIDLWSHLSKEKAILKCKTLATSLKLYVTF